MKKWIPILLLSLYLVSTTELNQFLKVPLLIEHYNEHHKLNPEMSLMAFLRTHYDHPAKDADYSKDSRLPFLRHSTLSLVFTIDTGFNFEVPCRHDPATAEHKYPVFDENFFVKGFLHSIWQPPRMA